MDVSYRRRGYDVRTMHEHILQAIDSSDINLFIEMLQHLMNANLIIDGSIAFPIPIAKRFHQDWDSIWHGVRRQDKLIVVKESIIFPNEMCAWNYNANVTVITLALQIDKKDRRKAMDFILDKHLYSPNNLNEVVLHDYNNDHTVYKIAFLYPIQEALFAVDLRLLKALVSDGGDINLLPKVPINEGYKGVSYTNPLFYLNNLWMKSENADDFKAALDLFATAGVDFNPKECFIFFIGQNPGSDKSKMGILNMVCPPKDVQTIMGMQGNNK